MAKTELARSHEKYRISEVTIEVILYVFLNYNK